MSKRHAKSWSYGVASAIFFLVAVINFWMIMDEGSTTFRIIGTVAFAVGSILLFTVFLRARRTES